MTKMLSACLLLYIDDSSHSGTFPHSKFFIRPTKSVQLALSQESFLLVQSPSSSALSLLFLCHRSPRAKCHLMVFWFWFWFGFLFVCLCFDLGFFCCFWGVFFRIIMANGFRVSTLLYSQISRQTEEFPKVSSAPCLFLY